MKKFRTWRDLRIDEVEVLRETEHYVFLPSREMKRTEHGHNYFDTRQEARQFLIDREKTAMIKALREMQKHQETLQKLQEMSQP